MIQPDFAAITLAGGGGEAWLEKDFLRMEDFGRGWFWKNQLQAGQSCGWFWQNCGWFFNFYGCAGLPVDGLEKTVDRFSKHVDRLEKPWMFFEKVTTVWMKKRPFSPFSTVDAF